MFKLQTGLTNSKTLGMFASYAAMARFLIENEYQTCRPQNYSIINVTENVYGDWRLLRKALHEARS